MADITQPLDYVKNPSFIQKKKASIPNRILLGYICTQLAFELTLVAILVGHYVVRVRKKVRKLHHKS